MMCKSFFTTKTTTTTENKKKDAISCGHWLTIKFAQTIYFSHMSKQSREHANQRISCFQRNEPMFSSSNTIYSYGMFFFFVFISNECRIRLSEQRAVRIKSKVHCQSSHILSCLSVRIDQRFTANERRKQKH